MKPPITRLD